MDGIYNLKERLCEELEEIGRKPTWDAGDLEIVDKLAHAMKNINKIINEEEKQEYGSYENEYSARYDGSGMNYSRSNRYGRSNRYNRSGRYNRYSMGNQEVADELRRIMNEMPDDTYKVEFQRLINSVSNG